MKRIYVLIGFFFTFWGTIAHSERLRFSKEGPLNFGVLVNNESHVIYRAERLGEDGLEELYEYLYKRRLPYPQTVVHMNRHGYKKSFPFLELFAVEEYKLQNVYGFDFYHSYRYDYRTYLDGKNPYHPEKDIDADDNLGDEAEYYFGAIRDGKVDGGVDAFVRILKLVLEAQGPVLFHCTGGNHRTGMVALAIRYLQGGDWVNGRKREATPNVFGPKVLLNPAQYEYYLHNKLMFRSENLEFVERFSREPIFAELQSQFRDSLNAIN